MPYQEHATFRFNPTAKIWRYMDFTKFVSILETKALYFPRIDQLDDRFEFSLPAKLRDSRRFVDGMEQTLYVNCWHRSKHESAAMWNLYLKSNEGIAIQTTAGRLAKSLGEFQDPVYIGGISYIDYKTYAKFNGNLFEFSLLKRKAFEHEKEIRAVHILHETYDGKRYWVFRQGPNPKCDHCGKRLNEVTGKGMKIPVILDKLIRAVYVAPGQSWLIELVQAVMRRYGQKAPIIPSALDDKPPT